MTRAETITKFNPPSKKRASAIELARDAIEKEGGDRERATASLAARLRSDEVLREDFLEAMIRHWVLMIIGQVNAQARTAIAAMANGEGSPSRMGSALREVANNAAVRLMDFPIFGGRPMSTATVAQVRASAERYLEESRSMSRLGRWQQAVANAAADEATLNGLPLDAPLMKVLDEETLQRLWDETHGA